MVKKILKSFADLGKNFRPEKEASHTKKKRKTTNKKISVSELREKLAVLKAAKERSKNSADAEAIEEKDRRQTDKGSSFPEPSELLPAQLEKIFEEVELRHLCETPQISKFKETDLNDYKKRLDGSDFGVVSSCQRDAGVAMVLGFDFGSTCSKAVIRFPYETISEAPEAIPAIECMAVENNPYYWKSEIFLRRDGTYSLLPNNDTESFTNLKMDFIRRAKIGENEITVKDIPVIAYLALMVKQALGWAKINYPNYSKDMVQLQINFGYPAANYNSNSSMLKYQKTASFATKLVEEQRIVSFLEIKNMLERYQNNIIEIKTPTKIIPEIVGAVNGFANSNESRLGDYLVADIGGLSVDYAYIGILNDTESGQNKINIYSANSKRIGVEILNDSKRTNLEMSRVLCSRIVDTLKEAYDKLIHPTKKWTGEKIPVFFTGGGRELGAYTDALRLVEILGHKAVFYRKCEMRDIHRFKGLKHSLVKDRIPDRLIVAYGLSYPELEMPDYSTPDQHRPAEKQKKSDFTKSYIGPEQV